MKNYPMIPANNQNLWHNWHDWMHQYYLQVISLIEWQTTNNPQYVQIPNDNIKYTVYVGKDTTTSQGIIYILGELNLNQYLVFTTVNTYLWKGSLADFAPYATVNEENKIITFTTEAWELFQRRFSSNSHFFDLKLQRNDLNVYYWTKNQQAFRFHKTTNTDEVITPSLNQATLNNLTYTFKNAATNGLLQTPNYTELETLRIGTTLLNKHLFTGSQNDIQIQRKNISYYLKFNIADTICYIPKILSNQLIFEPYNTENTGTMLYFLIDYVNRRWSFKQNIKWNYRFNTLSKFSFIYQTINNQLQLSNISISEDDIPWNGQPIIGQLINYQESGSSSTNVQYEEIIANTTFQPQLTNVDNKGYWVYTITMKNDINSNSSFNDFPTQVIVY